MSDYFFSRPENNESVLNHLKNLLDKWLVAGDELGEIKNFSSWDEFKQGVPLIRAAIKRLNSGAFIESFGSATGYRVIAEYDFCVGADRFSLNLICGLKNNFSIVPDIRYGATGSSEVLQAIVNSINSGT